MARAWRDYVNDLSEKDCREMLTTILQYHIDDINDMFSYRPAYDELSEQPAEECIYWEHTGESLLD